MAANSAEASPSPLLRIDIFSLALNCIAPMGYIAALQKPISPARPFTRFRLSPNHDRSKGVLLSQVDIE